MRISAAEFVRQFGRRCDEALAQPVIITRNGRDRLIVMSLAMYRTLTDPPTPHHVASFIRTSYPNITYAIVLRDSNARERLIV